MRITQSIMTVAAILLSLSAWAGDLSVDNLTVVKDATVRGTFNLFDGLTATGGTITTNGGYRIHTFTSSGTFTVTAGAGNIDVLVVAGGGGACAGGGGAGGMLYTANYSVTSTSYTVTVGAGGAGAVCGLSGPAASDGGNSSFGTLTTTGGGGGGNTGNSGNGVGRNGGSGGGGGPYSAGSQSGGTGSPGQGNNGGANWGLNASPYTSGGGGGAGAVGENAPSASESGDGGVGLTNSISGSTNVAYAGGGGGIGYSGGAVGVGGAGGGGSGVNGGNGNAGTANTGGGGGGASSGYTGGNGGSGVVIVRYPITSTYTPTLTISSNGISQVTASGNNSFMGKVGIGTNNPAEKLHVAGNARVDGTNIVSSMTLGNETRTNWPNVAVGALIASNNLSDVADVATARDNLGLGNAATNNTSAFVAPNGDGSQLTNITAAQVGALSTNAGALIAANNLSELTASAATARSNLGLGSAATNDTGAFLAPAGNGSQLTGITASQVGALSTNGGVVNGSLDIQYIPPKGDLIMGSYTNY